MVSYLNYSKKPKSYTKRHVIQQLQVNDIVNRPLTSYLINTCRVYFAKINSNDHKLNALLPNGRSVPFALRLCNKLPIPRAKLIAKKILNSVVFRAFSDRLVMDMYFNLI